MVVTVGASVLSFSDMAFRRPDTGRAAAPSSGSMFSATRLRRVATATNLL